MSREYIDPIQLVTAPANSNLSGYSLIEQAFIEAFEIALETGGQWLEFAFSDGVTTTGRICDRILILWILDESQYLNRHSHEYNSVVYQNEKTFMMLASDVPDHARLWAGDYLDAGEIDAQHMTSYKITSSVLKTGIWTIKLAILGTT
jgi:hypothetical protein